MAEYPVITKFIAHKKRRTISLVNTGNDTENSLVSQIITVFQNSSQQETLMEGVVVTLLQKCANFLDMHLVIQLLIFFCADFIFLKFRH